MKSSEEIKDIIHSLPKKAGAYQFFDNTKKILYIGKAKDLKKRVSSYFSKKHEHAKTRLLVSKINDIKYFVVPTEMDALLLENNLIKKYQPKYNVMLKDDKSYPFICIKNESFPRIFSTRKLVKDGSFYFGPYTSTKLEPVDEPPVSIVVVILFELSSLYPSNHPRLLFFFIFPGLSLS